MQPLCCVALGTRTRVSHPHDGPSGPLEPSGSCPEHPAIWGLVFNRDPAGLLAARRRRQTSGDGRPAPSQVSPGQPASAENASVDPGATRLASNPSFAAH